MHPGADGRVSVQAPPTEPSHPDHLEVRHPRRTTSREEQGEGDCQQTKGQQGSLDICAAAPTGEQVAHHEGTAVGPERGKPVARHRGPAGGPYDNGAYTPLLFVFFMFFVIPPTMVVRLN